MQSRWEQGGSEVRSRERDVRGAGRELALWGKGTGCWTWWPGKGFISLVTVHKGASKNVGLSLWLFDENKLHFHRVLKWKMKSTSVLCWTSTHSNLVFPPNSFEAQCLKQKNVQPFRVVPLMVPISASVCIVGELPGSIVGFSALLSTALACLHWPAMETLQCLPSRPTPTKLGLSLLTFTKAWHQCSFTEMTYQILFSFCIA